MLTEFDFSTLRTLLILGVALGQTLFTVYYLTFPWWQTLLGQVLFGKAVSLMILVDFYAASRLFDFRENDVAFTLIYFLLGLGVWSQLFVFVYVSGRRGPDAVSGNEDC